MNEFRSMSLIGIGRMARDTVMLSVILVSVVGGIAKAESPITAPTENSEHGIQSAITQSRDSLQQRMPTGKPQQQEPPLHRQPAVKKPDLHPSDQK
jgi:hypothetical protein